MYSAVLVLALTAGSDTVDFGRNRCAGATGCNGVVAYGCAGSHGGHGGHGCQGGLFGGRGCNGGHGCQGGLFGGRGCNGGNGCFNNCGGRGGLFGGHRNRGCSNPCGCTSAVYTTCAGGVIQGGTVIVPKTMPKSEPLPDPKKDKKPVAAPATIVVNLPAEARLFVDGSATTSTSETRTLVTPELQFGSTYVYTIRAEVVRDGQVVTETQHVNVTGGQTSTVRFNFSQTVASR